MSPAQFKRAQLGAAPERLHRRLNLQHDPTPKGLSKGSAELEPSGQGHRALLFLDARCMLVQADLRCWAGSFRRSLFFIEETLASGGGPCRRPRPIRSPAGAPFRPVRL